MQNYWDLSSEKVEDCKYEESNNETYKLLGIHFSCNKNIQHEENFASILLKQKIFNSFETNAFIS